VVLLASCGGTAKQVVEQPPATSLRHAGNLAGSVVLQGRTWVCRSRVDLELVSVEMTDSGKDAVHLGPGCTGTIRRLEIPGNGAGRGPGGDGVKVQPGAHDIQVWSGYIDCGMKAHRKHQDAIQAMGGGNVVFHRIVSRGCANSFMFINTGRGGRETPRGIRCDDCRAATHNYSVFVGSSIDSGAVGGLFTSRVPPHVTSSAVSPTLAGNRWSPRAGARARLASTVR
jgi:hypothetical protein